MSDRKFICTATKTRCPESQAQQLESLPKQCSGCKGGREGIGGQKKDCPFVSFWFRFWFFFVIVWCGGEGTKRMVSSFRFGSVFCFCFGFIHSFCLRVFCSNIVPTLLQHCSNTATTLFQYCYNIVPILLQHCSNTATTLFQHFKFSFHTHMIGFMYCMAPS